MKTFKILIATTILGLGAFFYTNPNMIEPLLTQASKLQTSLMKSFDNTKNKNDDLKQVKINTYKIDPNISNKEEYYVDARVKNMYTEISSSIIKRDKEIRERLLYVQDKSIDEIHARMAELEPFYEKEREKVMNYCQHGSKNCLVEVSLTGNSVEGSDVKVNLNYNLDAQSLAFFNEVHYVDQVTDKWYEAQFVSINEKRFYPKFGKFQDREQHSTLEDNMKKKVEVTHILEGNSNEWNVKF